MYRDFACRKARALGITGTVENLKNGGVYVVAEGEEASLKQYLEALRRGPLLARVTGITEKWLPFKNEFTNFSIIFYERR